MRLEDIIRTQLQDLPPEQLLEKVRQIRRNKYEVRPAKKKREKKVEAKAAQKTTAAIDKLIMGLSPEEAKRLLGGMLDG